MKPKEDRIDVDAAWARFERKAASIEPADVWTKEGNADAQSRNGKEESPVEAKSEGVYRRVEDQPNVVKRRRLRFRPWMAVGAAAVLLVGLFTTDIGDKALAAMLQTFRVQHISGVEIGQSDLDKLRSALEQNGVTAGELNLEKFGSVTRSGGGKPQQMPVKQAEEALGAPVKLLPGMNAEQAKVTYEPQAQFTLKLHVDEVNRLLKRLGGKTMFPSGADGQPIVGTLPASVQVTDRSGNGKAAARTLIQMTQPTLDIPSGIDVEQVRQAVLELPFLPDDVRSKLEGAGDWKQTLFVPMEEGTMKSVTIGGREVLVSENADRFMAVWLDGAYLYQLSGGGYASEAALLSDVKEIIGA